MAVVREGARSGYLRCQLDPQIYSDNQLTLTKRSNQVRENRLDRILPTPPHFQSDLEGIYKSAIPDV
jgi:hypothetical protein